METTENKYAPLEGYKKKCPECGKTFWAMADWAFKDGYKNSPVYICSWKCLRKRRMEKKQGKKNGREQKEAGDQQFLLHQLREPGDPNMAGKSAHTGTRASEGALLPELQNGD